MRPCLLICLLACSGCTLSQWYPVTGAVVGATGGSIAGPGGAAIGTAAGYGVGKGAQLMSENEELAETVEALTKGDVDELVAERLKDGLKKGMENQKGAIASAMDGVYDFIKLCMLGIVLWNLVPLVYTMLIHKKTKRIDAKTKLD